MHLLSPRSLHLLPSQPSFDLGIHSQLTPLLHLETPSYPPTSSSAPTLPINPPCIEPMTMIPTPCLYIEHHYPPTSSSSNPLGPPVGTDTPQLDTNVPDEHPPHQPSSPQGRPQRARRAPTCGIGGHKIGHKRSSMHNDEPKDDAPQPPPPPKHYTRVKKRKLVNLEKEYAKRNSRIGFPGALELITQCKNKGLKVAVASTAARIKVDVNLAAAG
nr:hypothetical protein CFP56_72841 [Quercus suber]